MKKYSTRPIDFTGCHPVIAEALKRGEDIKCRVWDRDCDKEQEIEVWVCRYRDYSNLPYLSESDTSWKHAEPILRKVRRIMPPERAIPTLIAAGWKYNKEGALVGDPPIVSSMFKEMGGLLDKSRAAWPPCIIEEVEDE